mgnify:CR=1 FL=1
MLEYDIDASLEALSLKGKILGISVDKGLVNKSYDILDGGISLYDKTFALGGINQQTFNIDVPAVI